MKVIALVGPSGTGKSHRAFSVARKFNTELIIDDGLLIHGAKVVAGCSAKKESTKLKAVRRAIFMDEAHAKEVRDKIFEINPDSVLVIGTSLRMVEKIVTALELPEPWEIVTIDSIATPREIKIARQVRKHQGKHVIPAPTFEIKRYFSGYLLDPLKIFTKKEKGLVRVEEKSVMRPTYSYLGKYTISDTAITSIISYEAVKVDGIVKTGRVHIHTYSDGIIVYADVIVEYGKPIRQILEEVQQRIIQKVEYITALNVMSVNITAAKIVLKNDQI